MRNTEDAVENKPHSLLSLNLCLWSWKCRSSAVWSSVSGCAECTGGVPSSILRGNKERFTGDLKDKQKLTRFKQKVRSGKERQGNRRYKGLKLEEAWHVMSFDWGIESSEKWGWSSRSQMAKSWVRQVKKFTFGFQGSGDWCQATFSATSGKRANLEVKIEISEITSLHRYSFWLLQILCRLAFDYVFCTEQWFLILAVQWNHLAGALKNSDAHRQRFWCNCWPGLGLRHLHFLKSSPSNK